MSEERRQPWARQDWETATAFARFQRYFLSQEPPRSLDEAYRAWYAQKHRLRKGHKKVTSKRAPGVWRNWSRGQDSHGNPIPGAQTWAERARAYDDHMAALAVQAEEEARRRILTQRFALQHKRVEALDALAEDLLGMVYAVDDEGNRIHLWLPDVKQIGSGDHAERVDIVRFNSPLVGHVRGLLDDIAAEMGERVKKTEVTGGDGGPLWVLHTAFEDISDDELRRLLGLSDDAAGADEGDLADA